MAETQYIGADSSDGFEEERIRLLRLLEDPNTIHRLENLPLQKGWRCLEVAAGDGSIAVWLADNVGADGRVVATDVDLRFLRDLGEPNLEVRQHDILQDDLKEGHYDLVHCRTLLMHLSEPDLAVERMLYALRPGGWLVLEESDYLSFGAAHPDHELAPSFNSTTSTILDILRSKGVVNVYFGRELRALVERFDVSDLRHEGTTRLNRGGDPAALYQRMNFCTLVRPHLEDRPEVDDRDFESLDRAFTDPSFFFTDRTIFAVMARKTR